MLIVLCSLFIVNFPFSCYIYYMTITQTVDIPADRRITLEVPREMPTGATIIAFTPARSSVQPSSGIEEVRQLLKKEMAEKGTAAVTTASGDGWEANVKESYA